MTPPFAHVTKDVGSAEWLCSTTKHVTNWTITESLDPINCVTKNLWWDLWVLHCAKHNEVYKGLETKTSYPL